MIDHFELFGDQVSITDLPTNIVTYVPRKGKSEVWQYDSIDKAHFKYNVIARGMVARAFHKFNDKIKETEYDRRE